MSEINRTSPWTSTVQMHGRDIPVVPSTRITKNDLEHVVESRLLSEWIRRCSAEISVSGIKVNFVLYRGTPAPSSILFITMQLLVDGAYRYAVVLRGATVVILPVLVCAGEEYTLVTQQMRPAIGEKSFEEIPAGMLDGDVIVARALSEFAEETGIEITRDDLCPLGGPLEPTPGLVSEPMHYFYVRRIVTRSELLDLTGRLTGNPAENEKITLKVIPLDNLRATARHDAKAHLAYYMYRERFPKRKARWYEPF